MITPRPADQLCCVGISDRTKQTNKGSNQLKNPAKIAGFEDPYVGRTLDFVHTKGVGTSPSVEYREPICQLPMHCRPIKTLGKSGRRFHRVSHKTHPVLFSTMYKDYKSV